jgi:uncharacterized protein
MSRPLIAACWEHLLFLNYRCPRGLLEPLVPVGTELETWDGECYVTLVGWYTQHTRVRGIGVPCHQTFEGVNLRFYVRRRDDSEAWRPGAVSIRELVPRRAVAAAARRWYHAPSLSLVMSNANDADDPNRGLIAYFWTVARQKFSLMATITGAPAEPAPDSHAAFITDRQWGYARTSAGGTLEYRVQHARWPVWVPESCSAEGPMHMVFGNSFAYLFADKPASAYVATGSSVSVFPGTLLPSV